MKVSIQPCKSYSTDTVNQALINGLAFVGDPIKKGQKVLLKVNMLSDKEPDKAVTTHPVVVAAVIDHVKSKGAIPIVGDSSFPFVSFKRVAEKTGIGALCKRKKVKLIDLSDPEGVAFHEGRLVKNFNLTKHLKEVDCIIDMPKLKTHSLMGMTAAIKNLFGLVSGKGKPSLHLRFPREHHFATMLLDLYSLMRPKICLVVMDAVVGMEGAGPANGVPKKIGKLVVGHDPLAVDVVAAKMTGLKVPYLAIAKKEGLPGSDIKDLTLDAKIEHIREFKSPKSSAGIVGKMFSVFRPWLVKYPVVDEKTCISCQRCFKSCPNKAITMKKKYPTFHYGRCIRCYCCHEMCPVHAIRLQKPLLLKRVFRRVKK